MRDNWKTAAVVLASTSMMTVPALAGTVQFNSFVSPANNELANDFVQTGTFVPAPYSQSANGGVSGGAVTGYTGNEYRATAVYAARDFDLSHQGSSVSLSLDLYFSGQLHPLAPGANGVRSFRLGLVTSTASSFETYGQPAAYIDGLASVPSGAMNLVIRNQTSTFVVSSGAGGTEMLANHWYQLSTTFTNVGGGSISYSGTFADIGTSGADSPSVLVSWLDSFANPEVAGSSSVYAAFSALGDGGISKADNLTVPGAIPEPATWALLLVGFFGLALMRPKAPSSAAMTTLALSLRGEGGE